MNVSLPTRVCALLLLFCFQPAALAQGADESTPPAPPDFSSLAANWWSYFDGSREEVEPRVSEFLAGIEGQIGELSSSNQLIAEKIDEAVSDNFEVYLALLEDTEIPGETLPEPAASYALDDLLELAATARDARSTAAAEQLEVEREQRILDGASQRRDALFKSYRAAPVGDRLWLTALRLVQARTAQAISERRLELLTQSFERATEFADAAAERVELAKDLLATTADQEQLNALVDVVDKHSGAVDAAREKLREAQIAASGLDLDTAQGRSDQRLEQQRLLSAEVGLAATEVAASLAEARRWWTELQLDTGPDLAELEEQALSWSELVRDIQEREPEWERQTEAELLAVQSADRSDLNRASRRLLDQRLGTAQDTLSQLGELDAAVADLQILMTVVDNALADYSGVFRSWLTTASRAVKSAYTRVTGLADVTLFSVGQTPVTGRDILRVVIILLVAMLLSRGIRRAIARVGRRDSLAAQASLYTVGRLTHYTIIIIAVFIALTSVGLDFGSLALVAGALSVGIGFGLQSIVNNFVSGLIVLFEQSLRIGDYIELDNGLTGTVKAINVRSTLINTNDNIDIVVPNSEFVTARLTNWTLGERILRVRIPFGVAYGSDKDVVRKAAIEAAEEVSYTLIHMKGREPDVWLVEYGDNSLNFLLLVWVNRQGARRPTRTRAAYLWALETKLSEYGIEIPFPQRDLHLRSGWPADAATADTKVLAAEPTTQE